MIEIVAIATGTIVAIVTGTIVAMRTAMRTWMRTAIIAAMISIVAMIGTAVTVGTVVMVVTATYGNVYQVALNQGFQDGLYTGSSDAQRGQNYDPQRSHFYRNGHGDNGRYGGYGNNNYQYQQAYRNGFLRGYDQGFQRYGGYNNNRRRNGNYGRFPFPW